jgi:FkbM family methyltransferase
VNRLVRTLLPRKIRPRRILGGPLRGARIVTSWHDYPAGIVGLTEGPLLDWFRRNVYIGQTWLDVGAHYGYTAIALSRRVGQNGRVFAFEPVTASAGCLAQARRLNGLSQLTIIPLGLGAPDTVACLRLPITRGMADRTIDPHHDTWCETIQTARFDWLWPHINAGNDTIHGIKIDVQGMELEVLSGMQEILRREQPKLVIEFHRGVDRGAVLDLLKAAGYCTDAVSIEPGSRPPAPTSDVADDCSYAFSPAHP